MNAVDCMSRSWRGNLIMETKSYSRLLRAEEVVEMTGWSRAKVYAMAVSGELPSLRSGRSVRIPLAALERWIEQNTTGGYVAASGNQSVYEARGPIVLGGA